MAGNMISHYYEALLSNALTDSDGEMRITEILWQETRVIPKKGPI